MKKLLIIMLMLFAVSLWAGSLEVVTGCNVRNSSDIKTSSVIGSVTEGMQFEILDIFGDYHYVEILKNSDNVGTKGWIWQGVIEKKDSVILVNGKGGTIRKEASKTSEKICCVINGTEIKILATAITWYKIKGSAQVGFENGWIYGKCVKEKK